MHLTAPSRRQALRLVPLAAVAPLAGGCSGLQAIFGTSGATVVNGLATVVSDVSNIATAASQYLGTLPGTLGTAVSGIVAKVQSVASAIGQAAAGGPSSALSGLISTFGSTFQSLLGAVGGASMLGKLGTFGSIIQAGLQLLPTILSVAGIALAPVAPSDERSVRAARAYLAALVS